MNNNFGIYLLTEILWNILKVSVLISFSLYVYLKIFKGNFLGYTYIDYWYLFIITGITTLIIQFFIKD